MSKPDNIFLVGPMGVGKSTIGRMLGTTLQRPFYDSDREIEAVTGADIPWIFDVEGEVGFRRREEEVIDELTQLLGDLVDNLVRPPRHKCQPRHGLVMCRRNIKALDVIATRRE